MTPMDSDGSSAQMTTSSRDIATLSSSSALVSLLQATKSLVTSLTAIGSEFNLTADDVLVLDALARHGNQSMAELSRHAVTSGATLTRSVDRLVSQALVYREVSAEDRRRVEVHLSGRGAETQQALTAQLADLNAEAGRLLGTPGSVPD